MNTGLITICNVLPAQSGAVPSAPSIAPKNAQNAADNATSPENSSDNNGGMVRNSQSNKDSQSFGETLRKKIDSQSVHKEVSDDKKKNEQELEPTDPEAEVPAMPSSADLLNPQPVMIEDAGLLELSAKVTGDLLTASVTVSTESTATVPIPTGQNTPQPVPASTLQPPIVNTQAPMGFGQDTPQAETMPTPQPSIENAQASVDIGLSAAAKNLTASDKPEILSSRPPLSVVPTEIQAGKMPPAAKNAETQLPIRNLTDLVENTPQPKPQQNTAPRQETLPQGLAESAISSIPSQNSPIQAKNPAARFFVRPENLSPEQLSSLQAEARKNILLAREGAVPTLESAGQPSDGTTVPMPVNEQVPASAPPVKIGTDTNLGLHLGRQIQESVSSSYRPGTQQILIRLDPPELGKITIKFVERPEGITGLLQVDKPQTRHEIQQALPGIIQTLQNADVQIKKLEVVLTNQQESNASGNQSAGHNGGFGQESPQNPHSLGHTPSYNEWRNKPEHLNDPAHPQPVWTDGSIDMLI